MAHENIEDLIRDQLGLCGCGDPRSCIDWIKSLLEHWHDKPSFLGNRPGYDEWAKGLQSLCGGEVQLEFMAHFLNDRGLLEHGTTVGSSWITQRGIDLIAAATKLPQKQ